MVSRSVSVSCWGRSPSCGNCGLAGIVTCGRAGGLPGPGLAGRAGVRLSGCRREGGARRRSTDSYRSEPIVASPRKMWLRPSEYWIARDQLSTTASRLSMLWSSVPPTGGSSFSAACRSRPNTDTARRSPRVPSSAIAPRPGAVVLVATSSAGLASRRNGSRRSSASRSDGEVAAICRDVAASGPSAARSSAMKLRVVRSEEGARRSVSRSSPRRSATVSVGAAERVDHRA